MYDRRAIVAGLGGMACVAHAELALATTSYPQLLMPDPTLWHVDTPPTTTGIAVGPNGAIAYRSYGSGPGTPVIVLHGGPAAGELYMRPYAGLATDRQVVLSAS